MECVVYCKKEYCVGREIESVVVWRGNVDFVPRVGDLINVWEGWCSHNVGAVWYQIGSSEVHVEIPSDDTGEYLAEAVKRGIKQWNEKTC